MSDRPNALQPSRLWNATVSRWLVLLVAVPVLTYRFAYEHSAGFRDQFQAVVAVSAEAVTSDPATVRGGVAWDLLFIASWTLVVLLLRWSANGWLPPYRQTLARYRSAWAVAAAALVLDLIEDGLLVVATTWSHSSAVLVALATVGWVKAGAYVASVALGVIVLGSTTVLRGVHGWVVAHTPGWHPNQSAGLDQAVLDTVAEKTRGAAVGGPDCFQDRAPDDATPEDQRVFADHRDPDGIGICLSGGGIRAAAVAFGALRALDRPSSIDHDDDPDGSLFQSANWIVSVSGGGYTAGGWRASNRGATAHVNAPDDRPAGMLAESPFADGSPWATHVSRRHRYLMNGFGSLTGGIAGALVRLAIVLGTVAGAAVVLGWLWGAVTSSRYVVDDSACLLYGKQCPSGSGPLAARLWWPGLVVVAVGLLAMVVVQALPPDWTPRANAVRYCLYTILGGLGLVVLLVGLTAALRYDRSVAGWIYEQVTPKKETSTTQTRSAANTASKWIAVISALGVFTALINIVRSHVKKRWLRLGGIALGALIVVGAERFAHVIAAGQRPWLGSAGSVPVLVIATVALWLAVQVIPSHRLSLHGTYRKRIAETFVTKYEGQGARLSAVPLRYDEEPNWQQYQALPGPQLIVALTAHSSTRRPSGLKGSGFTFAADRVTLYDDEHTPVRGVSVPTSEYATGSWWLGFPHAWSVSRAMALSGAAITSAMGRQGLGTTNALLAALNVRLGMWVPNPRHPEYFATCDADKPRVGVSYLAKEIFGRYRLDTDPFVYVADGGHRDNLGLVEMLRRKPAEVFVVDASGDTPGSFTTLRETIDLAFVELGVRICMEWPPIVLEQGSRAGLPDACATTGVVTYPDGTEGRLYYARRQLSHGAGADLRSFKACYPAFPDYSTADQFLEDAEFGHLIMLGCEMGDALLGLADLPRREAAGAAGAADAARAAEPAQAPVLTGVQARGGNGSVAQPLTGAANSCIGR